MSNQSQREKHGERFFQKIKKLARKLKLAKEYHHEHALNNPHKYHKKSLFTCGNPECVGCMNPRKAFKEKTMQERKFEQQEKIKDD